MSEKSDSKRAKERTEFSREVATKAARKLKARRNSTPGVWFGLGMMGLVGWSVTVPTVLGVALGIWLDKRYPESHSWTLALLVAGLAIGCFNAGIWIAKEDKAMREEQEDNDD
jgi:ATP synthase protein I